MTNTPGEGSHDESQPPYPPPPPGAAGPTPPGYWEQQAQQQPGYWEQQAQQSGYGVPPGQPPYGSPYAAPQYYQPQDHPRATTALILGILGLICCGFLAPFAWVIGGRAVREIDASAGQLGGRGQAMAGKVLGIIGTVLLILGVVYIIVVMGLVIAGEFDSGGSFGTNALD